MAVSDSILSIVSSVHCRDRCVAHIGVEGLFSEIGRSAPMKSVFADKCKVVRFLVRSRHAMRDLLVQVWPCDTQSIEEEQSDGAVSQASCVDLDLAAGSCPRSWVSRVCLS